MILQQQTADAIVIVTVTVDADADATETDSDSLMAMDAAAASSGFLFFLHSVETTMTDVDLAETTAVGSLSFCCSSADAEIIMAAADKLETVRKPGVPAFLFAIFPILVFRLF